jgi:hypothetical protein
MAPLGSENLSPQELSQKQADLEEQQLVEGMLTEAAGWYHKQLKSFPQIVSHLKNHYGFSDEIIEELQIGFAHLAQVHEQLHLTCQASVVQSKIQRQVFKVVQLQGA